MKFERTVCRVIAPTILALAVAEGARAQDIPKDADGFTQYLAGRIRAELGESNVAVNGALTLKLGELQANLDRIFTYCKQNASGCGAEVSTYVKGVVDTYKARTAPITADAVRVVLRTSQYVAQVQNSFGPGAPALLQTPFVEGLVLVPVFDSPTTMRLLSEADLKRLGLSESELDQRALANLRDALRTKPLMEVAKAAGAGQIGHVAGDSYDPSRLALVDTWAPLAQAQGGKLIVVAPASDAVFYVGDDSRVAIDALRTLARNVMGKAPHPLSDTLLRWTPTGWEIVTR